MKIRFKNTYDETLRRWQENSDIMANWPSSREPYRFTDLTISGIDYTIPHTSSESIHIVIEFEAPEGFLRNINGNVTI
jgi:hypothetical protein